MSESRKPSRVVDATGRMILEWTTNSFSDLEHWLHEGASLRSLKEDSVYRLELLIFCLFPVDALVQKEWGPEAPGIRGSMRRALVETARQHPELPDPNSFGAKNIDQLVSRRFKEYNAAFGFDRPFPSLDAGADRLRELGSLAYRRITGDRQTDPMAAQMLSTGFRSIMNALAEPISFLRERYATTLDKDEIVREAARKAGFRYPTCVACGKLLHTGEKLWSWESYWAEHVSGEAKCWSCTPFIRRALVLTLVFFVVGYTALSFLR